MVDMAAEMKEEVMALIENILKECQESETDQVPKKVSEMLLSLSLSDSSLTTLGSLIFSYFLREYIPILILISVTDQTSSGRKVWKLLACDCRDRF